MVFDFKSTEMGYAARHQALIRPAPCDFWARRLAAARRNVRAASSIRLIATVTADWSPTRRPIQKLLDPPTLIFAYSAGRSTAVYVKAWEGFINA